VEPLAALLVIHLALRMEQSEGTDPMNKVLACLMGCVAVAFLALAPVKAFAGWGWWGGPGVSITIGPRYGYYYRPYGYYGYPYGYGYRPYAYYRPYGYYGGYYGYRPYWRRHYRRWH
jgi:hypothetical protein